MMNLYLLEALMIEDFIGFFLFRGAIDYLTLLIIYHVDVFRLTQTTTHIER